MVLELNDPLQLQYKRELIIQFTMLRVVVVFGEDHLKALEETLRKIKIKVAKFEIVSYFIFINCRPEVLFLYLISIQRDF